MDIREKVIHCPMPCFHHHYSTPSCCLDEDTGLHYVVCDYCLLEHGSSTIRLYDSKDGAIQQWNKQQEDLKIEWTQDQSDKLDRMRKSLQEADKAYLELTKPWYRKLIDKLKLQF
jgi:hypothetical protein